MRAPDWIDAVEAKYESLRGNDDFLPSDRDTPMIDRDGELRWGIHPIS